MNRIDFDRAEPNFLNKKNFGVSVKYGSLSACLKKQLFYIDDVKALFYGLLELGSNPLPWAKEKDINKIIYMKMNKDYILVGFYLNLKCLKFKLNFCPFRP